MEVVHNVFSSTRTLLSTLLWGLPVWQVYYPCLVVVEIKPHSDYTVFLNFSQIANNVFDVHSIGLSFYL